MCLKEIVLCDQNTTNHSRKSCDISGDTYVTIWVWPRHGFANGLFHILGDVGQLEKLTS